MCGELFIEYQLAAQKMQPDRFIATAAYGEYAPGYIGTEISYSQGGYEVGSAYTTVKDKANTKFLYRDELWTGADLVSVGVASFGHLDGVHYQNQADIVPYVSAVMGGDLPIYRAYEMNEQEKLIREFILQLKLGSSNRRYFIDRFGVDTHERFGDVMRKQAEAGEIEITDNGLTMDTDTLLQVDRLLHDYFLPAHQDARYT